MNLISKSKNIFEQLNIKELQKAGIEREDIKHSSHSHIIVTYPPYSNLSEINPSEIYSNTSKKNSREIAFYLHLPFCTGKCLYCPYKTLAKQSVESVDSYIDTLEKEIKLLLKSPVLNEVILKSIYIGGGTPTYLQSQQLERVFEIIKNNFTIKNGAEITIEAEPDTIITEDGKEKLKTLLKNGVNRLSIGFQTFNNDILKFIGRRHTFEQATEAYNIAKEVGFENINIDLITGLPDQTLEVWENDLMQAMKLNPNSITCYPFYLKEGTGLWSIFKKEPQRFSTKELVILMNIMTAEFFKEHKFIQRPLRWFAKEPKYMYHQQLFKWEEIGEQLAIGPSSYSFINDFQYFNQNNIPGYLDSVNKGELPIEKGAKLNQEDLMRRLIIFGLKSQLQKKIFKDKFSIEPREVFKNIWDKLENLGLIKENNEIIQLSYKGRLFADEVAKEFFSDKIKKLLK